MHKLDAIFRPDRMAVFGAGEIPRRVGSAMLRNLVGRGFRGAVYPVQPMREAVLGPPAFTGLDVLPRTPDQLPDAARLRAAGVSDGSSEGDAVLVEKDLAVVS